MSDNTGNPEEFDEGMSDYLQTFLDETEEQLDDLVETMLSLEDASTNEDDLNEAFRLVHSIKGSAGLMGLNSITVLTHQLENRFERFRSGTEVLDEPTMNLVLRCIDFLRQCNSRLRDGQQLGSPTELLAELKQLEEQNATEDSLGSSPERIPETDSASTIGPTSNTLEADNPKEKEENAEPDSTQATDHGSDEIVRIVVHFRDNLQLVDLKAQLIVNRLANLGELKSTEPSLDSLPEEEQLESFTVSLVTDKASDELRSAADVDGVESIEITGNPELVERSAEPDERAEQFSEIPRQKETSAEPDVEDKDLEENEIASIDSVVESVGFETAISNVQTDEQSSDDSESTDVPSVEASEPSVPVEISDLMHTAGPAVSAASEHSSVPEKAVAPVAETMRVDIDRLDNLMNLAGELVVNRARFVQISGQISPAQRKATTLNRIREFCDGLRHTIDELENDEHQESRALIQQLRSGLDLMDEHSEDWERDRRYLEKFGDAIDQLSRVSQGLQKGVLDTRMVPVGPLFNRFRRVTRDLSKERNKQVHLQVRGEKTELDKRMIDELGDPLVHLVRNSIDHGLEPTDVRVAAGKPEVGTISLEATHSGNNVYIHVQDDGGGIDVSKIKAKLIANEVLSENAAAELNDEQALEYIWHPGFSTASKITDISGRGVGMDVVQNRIRQLNGSITVESVPKEGTRFTIRLPLTLAIINCLLVKLQGVVFSMPIDEVREIVSVAEEEVIDVQGKQSIDVRDEFIPLVSINDIFHWHHIDYGHWPSFSVDSESDTRTSEVVILQTAGKAMGIRVDELLGSQDMVIKSLSDNFIHIRGLSGASILGDGSVCLMLDVGTLFHLATQPKQKTTTEELMT